MRKRAAKAWSVWEGATSNLRPAADYIAKFDEDRFAEAFAHKGGKATLVLQSER